MFEGTVWSLIDGRPLGKWSAYRRRPTKREQEIIANYLERVTKQRGDNEMAGKTTTKPSAPAQQPENQNRDQCNMVFLAGRIASNIGVYDGKNARFLIDCGPEGKKWVPCTIYDEHDLTKKMERFEKGDYIKLVGYVRIWYKKDESSGEWVDNTEIRVTQIKNEPPDRPSKPASAMDDDIPY